MKYFIKTYGCQMNYSDSERIAGILETADYEKALSEDNADLIIINACSIRQSAINKISGRFKKYKKFREANPNLKIILTGCVLESDKKKFEKMFDLVVGIGEIRQFVVETRHCLVSTVKPVYQNKFSAYVPIMTGCNNFCSYCVVPYTRGQEYSRPVEDIINEVAELVERGCKEIILLGQNVNSYQSKVHKVESRKYNFPKLLELINNIPGDFWIRFLTSHPKDMSEELIKTVTECEKVTPHIHLALQSGDDEILKKMNRKYTAKHFLGLVKMIRKYLPDAAISTDIIIGFPGETEKRFQNTIEVMKKARFDMAYLNKYSPRAGTAAAKLSDDISWAEKKRREKKLNEVLKKTALENNEKYVGKVVEVLVDKVEIKKLGNLDTGILFGKTKSFKNVKINLATGSIVPSGLWNRNAKRLHRTKATMEPTDLIGKFVNIKITRAGAWGLEGKMAK